MESVNNKAFDKLNRLLAQTGDGDNDDTILKELRSQAAEIFKLDENGNLLLVRRGKYKVPVFNKLYVLFNMKRVFAFFGAVLQYSINSLSGDAVVAPKVADKFDLDDDEKDDDAETSLPADLDAEVERLLAQKKDATVVPVADKPGKNPESMPPVKGADAKQVPLKSDRRDADTSGNIANKQPGADKTNPTDKNK